MERRKYATSFAGVLEHLRPRLFITDRETLDALGALQLGDSLGCRLISAADVPESDASGRWEWLRTDPSPDAIVLIQHSSGTTGLQKGVALSHRAVLTQVAHYSSALNVRAGDKIVSWLPLYHDMGLIACFLLPILCRIPFVQMSPFDWVLRPKMLLDAIHRHEGTLCFLPNFAYEFLSASVRPDQTPGLSVASMRGFVNCSEPVSAGSQRRFHRRFRDHGVTEEKLWSCYAMAENVFAVTQSKAGESPNLDRVQRSLFTDRHVALPAGPDQGEGEVLEFVSCGCAIPGTEVQIRDDAGARCPERAVGEIWIRGDSLFSGYYRREDLTCEAFTADGWYKTGDLGYLFGEELYVTGRKKDLIIVQGRNFYPSDIEAVVSRVVGVIPGRAVAFGVMEERLGTEAIVVLAETEASAPLDLEQLQLTIRSDVAQQLDCTLGYVYLVPPKWLVKSTAGKIARTDSRNKFYREMAPARSPSG